MEHDWINIGDANPLEYGSVFIKRDKDFQHCYHVVRLINMDEATGEEGYLIGDGYIDLQDEWIDWKGVLTYIGAENKNENEVDDVEKILGLLPYYGVENFGGTYNRLYSEQEAIEELDAYGIELDVHYPRN